MSEMYDLVEEARARVAGLPMPCRVFGYGHLGDGNLHLNVSTAHYDSAVLQCLEPWVYEWTAARRGSISAEHGLGRMKAECIGCAAAPRLTCSPVLLHCWECAGEAGVRIAWSKGGWVECAWAGVAVPSMRALGGAQRAARTGTPSRRQRWT